MKNKIKIITTKNTKPKTNLKPPNITMSKIRKWCFTINNDARLFYQSLEGKYEEHSTKIQYICGQLEEAESGQLHFQGYLQLKAPQRLSWLQNHIHAGGHYEKQRKTNQQARTYCTPDKREATQTWIADTFEEFGTFVKGQGSRTDLIGFRDAILSGKRKIDLIESHIKEMAKFPRFYQMVRSLKRPVRTTDLTVRLNFGGTGLGKTRYAFDNHVDDLYVIPITSNTLWFDGYDLQKTCLIDDFAGAASKVSLNYTLCLLDRYPRQVPVKGGFAWWMPDTIIVTTNIHPRQWYKWDKREQQYAALLRRITEVWYYRDSSDPVHLLGQDRGNFDSDMMMMVNDSLSRQAEAVPLDVHNGRRTNEEEEEDLMLIDELLDTVK